MFVAETAEMLEVRARGFGIFVEGRDGHEAAGFELGEWLEGAEESGKFLGGEAVLGFFGRKLDLDEDAEGFVESLGCGVETLGSFEGVEGVDGVEDLGGFGGLVVLQRADEVGVLRGRREASRGLPRGVWLEWKQVRELGAFGLPLLDAILDRKSVV